MINNASHVQPTHRLNKNLKGLIKRGREDISPGD